ETPKPAQKPKTGKVELLGMTLSEITPALKKQYELADDSAGVVVTEVKGDSAASEKGLTAGDLIVEVDQKSVAKPDDIDKQRPRRTAIASSPCWCSARATIAGWRCASTRAEAGPPR